MRSRVNPQATKPRHVSEHAEACLRALVSAGLANTLSLGGALGLLHYLDYRPTRDVDAWWSDQATAADRQQVVAAIEAVLRGYGEVHTRAWGDVVSVELQREGRTVFSFQVARRSVQLEPPAAAPWIAVPLDSFADLLASKMVALVERGAPRDFRDIYMLCQAGLTTPARAWELWGKRQEMAGADTDRERAALAVQTHLARIVQHRPLPQVADPEQRVEAERVRNWFQQELLKA
jgi:hypothetical protein